VRIISGRRRRGNSRLRSLALLCALSFSACVTSSGAQSPPPEFDLDKAVEESLGTFDEKGRLHNETEKAYALPDIGAFFGFYPESGDLATGLTFELYDKKWKRGFLNKFKYDLFISEQRMGFGIGRKVVPVIDITVSAVFSRNFETNDWEWGLSFGLVKF